MCFMHELTIVCMFHNYWRTNQSFVLPAINCQIGSKPSISLKSKFIESLCMFWVLTVSLLLLALLHYAVGHYFQVPVVLSLPVPWSNLGEEKVWCPGVQYSLWVYWWWFENLYQSARNVPWRVRWHPLQGVFMCTCIMQTCNVTGNLIRHMYIIHTESQVFTGYKNLDKKPTHSQSFYQGFL